MFENFGPLVLGGRLVIDKPGGHEDPGYVRDLVTSQRCHTSATFRGTYCPLLNTLANYTLNMSCMLQQLPSQLGQLQGGTLRHETFIPVSLMHVLLLMHCMLHFSN